MIGVAISTCRRPREQTLDLALAAWERFLPDNAALTVIDADTLRPDGQRAGTAEAKNASIASLIDAGARHLFLCDDDVWPVIPLWWRGYVAATEPHLSLSWGRARRLQRIGPYTTWRWPRGVVLYAEARVIDKVGGMRTGFDQTGGGEHIEWSRRIHNAGLTRWPFADLTSARRWWHAEDWGRPGEPGHRLAVRREENTTVHREPTKEARYALYDAYRDTSDYVPFC